MTVVVYYKLPTGTHYYVPSFATLFFINNTMPHLVYRYLLRQTSTCLSGSLFHHKYAFHFNTHHHKSIANTFIVKSHFVFQIKLYTAK